MHQTKCEWEPDIESGNHNFLLSASTLRGVKNLLVNLEGKMKGGIS